MRARQCGYHQPKPHEIQRQHDFEQSIDYEGLNEAGVPYDRYPPALPTKPHGARADGWGLGEENEGSVSDGDNFQSSTTSDKTPKDDTDLSDELQGEATGSNAQQSGDLILPEVEGTKNDYDDIGQTEQGKLHEEQAILGPEQQSNAESQSDNTMPGEKKLGSDEVITDDPSAAEEDHRASPQDADLSSQIEELEAEVEELGSGLYKPDQDQDTANGLDSEPESDSDPNTLTEEAEGVAARNVESMPILT